MFTETPSSRLQEDTKSIVNYYYLSSYPILKNLLTEKHKSYLERGYEQLSSSFTSLDASRPWIIYWITHSLDLLSESISEEKKHSISHTLSLFQNTGGGFGGGRGQISHLAPTYAAVNALMIIEAYDIVNREEMYKFLMRMKNKDGSFTMHESGEVDIRGSYCAISVASLLNILTEELCENVAEFISSCQNYDGGLSSVPGLESHGGYTFCGLATLRILNRTDVVRMSSIIEWASNRQMASEGGFQGRPNKLVDGCYSFWLGGLFPLVGNEGSYLMDREKLLAYTLLCQSVNGGFSSRPGDHVDYYHTCYGLSGISTSLYHYSPSGLDVAFRCIAEHKMIKPTHPFHNISLEKVNKAIEHYKEKI
jgi:protein farnesyltransferase subunit beta